MIRGGVGLMVVGTILMGCAPLQTAGRIDRWDAPGAANPIIPGYFADPSLIAFEGRWYLFATIDPWGGDSLGAWSSPDLANWTFRTLDWPTKAAATSPTSGDAKVWAPSVIRGPDGRFWMYVSVGSEVWVGVADRPLGPWRDALDGRPLIPRDFRPGYHMIDAEAFVDRDGSAWLYWGSGLDWVNGRAFAVRLASDMIHFDGEPVDVTPANYFEAPFMSRVGDRYVLTYSSGKTLDDTYQVHQAVGDTPLGPFVEPQGGPVLSTDADQSIIGPGHQAVVRIAGRPNILYHRHAMPYQPGGLDVRRQIALDALTINDGRFGRVRPSHHGPGRLPHRLRTLPVTLTSSSPSAGPHEASRAADDNYATLWRTPAGQPGMLTADMGRVRALHFSELRPEYPTRRQDFRMEASADGSVWTEVTGVRQATGSPIRIEHPLRARYLRLRIDTPDTGLFEWVIR